jgi:signal peptidase
LFFIQSQASAKPAPDEEAAPRRDQPSSLWILVAVVGAGAVWFNTGLFGVRPSLVSGISMNPTLLAGDVVISHEVPAEKLQVGDIVRFRKGEIYIVHRVKEIHSDESGLWFITRGDNNNVDDDPVKPNQIEGKVVVHIPKIGWVAIIFRRVIEWLGFAPR